MNWTFVAFSLLMLPALLLSAVTSNRRFVYLCAFVLPLQGLAMNAGVLITWAKLLLPVALLVRLVRARHSFGRRAVLPGARLWGLFLAYITLLTFARIALGSHADDIQRALSIGWARGQSEYRLEVQLTSAVLFWGLIFAGHWFAEGDLSVGAALNGFIAGNLFNAVTGFGKVGADLLGLSTVSALLSSPTETLVGVDEQYRLEGFAGEPKHAAAGFVLALAILMWARHSQRYRKSIPLFWPKTVVLLAALLFTRSTSGWLAAVAGGVYFVLVVSWPMRWRLAACFGLIGVGVMLISGRTGFEVVDRNVEDRVLKRAADPGRFEVKDQAFWQYALENPSSLVIGQGAGGVDFKLISYIDPVYLHRGGTISPSYLVRRNSRQFRRRRRRAPWGSRCGPAIGNSVPSDRFKWLRFSKHVD